MLWEVYCVIWCVVRMVVSTDTSSHLTGHMGKFGTQRPPELDTPELYDVPHPREFWEEYVKPRRPVLFRGAAKHSRAFHHWTEDYLASEYGDLVVRLEGRHEDGQRLPAGGEGILGRDTMGHFIRNYQTMDAYVISQIPQPMEKDVSFPPCLRCGSFLDSVQEVHLFMSAGGGKTMIHRDPYSTIHCVFNGTKDWWLLGQNQTHLVYESEESSKELGGFSIVDVNAVDLEKFPSISDVKYSRITMNKGDCIFVPGGIWHHVRSNGYMNTAVSIWFSRLYEFSDMGCDKADIKFTPMDKVPVLWRFSGHGVIPHGHMDLHFIRKLFLTSADSEGKIILHPFVEHFFSTTAKTKKDILDKDLKERGRKLMQYLDPDNKGYILKEEIEAFSIEKMKEVLLFFDPIDVSNMEDFEYSHINAEDIMYSLEMCLHSDGHFDETTFINNYTEELGGTVGKAREIISNINPGNVSSLSREELGKRAPVALHKYLKSLKHDPSFEHKMLDHLRRHWRDEL
ncbi:predicted protein [Nematostella vectensis]|uniref:JmjC domain-containing protein n=1 Tax=Nematostella vectensis TaxID=45351 RepID=A7RJB5_NEMVE|nr:predicted protein [Nematostella vectensis]|eukprot:XP_001640616.1 predicted protein [Nematostella vectensis]